MYTESVMKAAHPIPYRHFGRIMAVLFLALVASIGLAVGTGRANEHEEASSSSHGEAAAKDAPAGLPEPPPKPKEVIEPVVQGLRPAPMPAQSRSRMTSKLQADASEQGTDKPFDAAGIGWVTPYPVPVIAPRDDDDPSHKAVTARRCLAWGLDGVVRENLRQTLAALGSELTDRPSLKVRDVATPVAWVRRAAAPAETDEAEPEPSLSLAQAAQGTNTAPGPILLPGRWGEGSEAASGEPPVSSYHIQPALLPSSTTRRPVKVAAPKPPAAPPIPIAASQPKASPSSPAPSPEETDQSILSALQSAIRDMGASNKIQVPQPQAGSEHLNFETPAASPPQPAPAKGR